MKRIIKRTAAQQDLDGFAERIQQDSPQAAIRFLEAADQACELLAAMPEMGGLYETSNPALTGLRFWSIRKFEKHLIFYLPLDDGIEVVRVLHGSRNIDRILQSRTK